MCKFKDYQVIIYTDGSSLGNPGPGGYGVVYILKCGLKKKEFSGGFRKTTNNRMELLAVIVALENLEKVDQKVLICSDSTYVVKTVKEKWLWKWLKIEFKGKKNEDLWRKFLKIYSSHQIKFEWINSRENPKNEYYKHCDRLAKKAASNPSLPIDEGYV